MALARPPIRQSSVVNRQYHAVKRDLVSALIAATNAPGIGLADATLIIARIEYPRLDPEPYLAKLDS